MEPSGESIRWSPSNRIPCPYLDFRREIDKVSKKQAQARGWQGKPFGNKDQYTLDTMCRNAGDCFAREDRSTAQKWLLQALDREPLWEEDATFVNIINKITDTLSEQGLYEKALELHHWALNGMRELLGMEHPDTLKIMDGIAEIYSKQGNYDEALEWHHQVLDGRKWAFGDQDFSTLHTTGRIASLHHIMERPNDNITGGKQSIGSADRSHNNEVAPTKPRSKSLLIADVPVSELCSHASFTVRDCREEVKRRVEAIKGELSVESFQKLQKEPIWVLMDKEDFEDDHIAIEQLRRDYDYEDDEDDEDKDGKSIAGGHSYKKTDEYVDSEEEEWDLPCF